jgi:hypothetical protein
MLHNLSGYKIILIIVQTRMSPYQQKKVPIFCSHVPMIPCSSDVSRCSHNVHILFHYFSIVIPMFLLSSHVVPTPGFAGRLTKHNGPDFRVNL